MPVMEFASDLSQCTSEERAKCLFFAGCNITEDTDVLAVSINQGRIKTWFLALTYGWFLIKISNLQIRISAEDELGIFTLFLCELGVSLHRDDKFEFPTCHTLEFAIELVRITPKHLHDFRVLNPVEKFDSTGVVHETGDGTIKSL